MKSKGVYYAFGGFCTLYMLLRVSVYIEDKNKTKPFEFDKNQSKDGLKGDKTSEDEKFVSSRVSK